MTMVIANSFDVDLYINNQGPYEGTLHVETASVEATTIGDHRVPDYEWFVIDNAGHFHSFNLDTGSLVPPTLRVVETTVESDHVCNCPDCDQRYENPIKTYQCNLCGEEVQPNFKEVASVAPFYIPGRKSAVLKFNSIAPPNLKIGEVVSFRTKEHFGTGTVLQPTLSKGGSGDLPGIEINIACSFIATRGASQSDL